MIRYRIRTEFLIRSTDSVPNFFDSVPNSDRIQTEFGTEFASVPPNAIRYTEDRFGTEFRPNSVPNSVTEFRPNSVPNPGPAPEIQKPKGGVKVFRGPQGFPSVSRIPKDFPGLAPSWSPVQQADNIVLQGDPAHPHIDLYISDGLVAPDQAVNASERPRRWGE